jgi:hypothetical protein
VKNLIRTLAVLMGVAILAAPFAMSTPEISKKEDKQCTVCHTALGKPDLNDAGKYYKVNRTLKGYEEKKKPEAPKPDPVR